MSRSLKAVAAAAATLCLSAPALAQSTVSVYGLMDASVGQFQDAGARKLKRVQSGNMTTSYFGFKGTEDLGTGLKAVFALEAFLRLDTGEQGRFGGDNYWARNAYVGLSGDFGTTTLGRNTNPFFVSTLAFNAIGDSFGFSPAIRQILTPRAGMLPFLGDTGWSNSLLYSTPKFGGFSGNLIANLGETNGANSYGNNLGGNINYFGDALSFTVAAQKVKNATGAIPAVYAGFENQQSLQGGIAYDFKVVKLFAQAAKVKTDATTETSTKIYQLGASVPIGPGKALVQYGHAKADFGTSEATNKTLTVGYDYFVSKRTDLYAIYVNDRFTGVSNGNTYAAGMRFRY